MIEVRANSEVMEVSDFFKLIDVNEVKLPTEKSNVMEFSEGNDVSEATDFIEFSEVGEFLEVSDLNEVSRCSMHVI